MPGSISTPDAVRPARRSKRLAQSSSSLNATQLGAAQLRTGEVRKSRRKPRAPAPPDQGPVASGSTSKPQVRRAKSRVPGPKKEPTEKPSLKRKRVDDEDAVTLKRRLREEEMRGEELQRLCNELEKTHRVCESKKAALEEREETLQAWEELQSMSVEERAKLVLKKIENTYTCPLCVDIMACPYKLTVNSSCGHTFCASCIIQFTHLEFNNTTKTFRYDCPVCRKGLVWSATHTRPCLWVPDRLNREAIVEWLDELAEILGELPSPPRSPGRDAKRKKQSHMHESPAQETIYDWRIGGSLRLDWERRDKEGSTKIANTLPVRGKH